MKIRKFYENWTIGFNRGDYVLIDITDFVKEERPDPPFGEIIEIFDKSVRIEAICNGRLNRCGLFWEDIIRELEPEEIEEFELKKKAIKYNL